MVRDLRPKTVHLVDESDAVILEAPQIHGERGRPLVPLGESQHRRRLGQASPDRSQLLFAHGFEIGHAHPPYRGSGRSLGLARPRLPLACGRRVGRIPRFLATSIVQLALEILDPVLEGEDVPDPREGQSLVGEDRHLLHQLDLEPCVPPLAAVGACRLDDRFGVQPTEEGWLDAKHLGHLPHGEEWGVLVVKGPRRRPQSSWARHR